VLDRYGGPNSQSADVRFRRDWHHYLACEKKIIVLTVDNRGTGLKGRKFRNVIRDDLGRYEVIDQVNAAREWAKKRYVDIKRIGIWGWVSATAEDLYDILIVWMSAELRRLPDVESD
jgi:dipeptidyl aminopeptidase